jgi:4-hydroxybenzoate polyprenyltransferase
MNKFLEFTKLIRFKNLVMIALTQVLFKYSLINMYLENFSLNSFQFIIYLLALLLVVAGGYIINDIYDIETDKINRKENQIVGNSISSKSAFNFYYLLNSLAFLFGFYIAFSIGKTAFGFIFIFFAFSLWRYSKQHKTSFAIGNFQVGFLTALSIINLILFDLVPIGINNENGSLIISKIIIFYAGFSFLTTLIREIVKDIEDLEGDQKINAKTLAITYGLKKSKNIVLALTTATIFCITYFQYFQYSVISTQFEYEISIWGVNDISIIYTLLLQGLFLFFIYKSFKAINKEDFHFLSILSKIIMLVGILSIPVFTFLHQN